MFLNLKVLSFTLLFGIAVLFANKTYADRGIDDFKTLTDHIGDSEKVNLTIYFVGFDGLDSSTKKNLVRRIKDKIKETKIIDAKPWYIPNIPKHGLADFSTVPAPADLPPEITPPDGLIRFEDQSLVKDDTSFPGFVIWRPTNGIELKDSVADWLKNNDVVNNVEHKGSLRNVRWQADHVKIKFLSAKILTSLYNRLEDNPRLLESENPDITFTLYSYNELFDWMEKSKKIKRTKGGATLVFFNLERFNNQDFSFYAEADKDLVPLSGFAPSLVQYPEVTASTPEHQTVADILTTALDGGIPQAKMKAALETKAVSVTNAQDAGLDETMIPGIRPTQSIAEEWALEPVRNLVGNKGRLFFASNSTELVRDFGGEQLSESSFIDTITQDFFELYRYGVLAQSIKANHDYSEAHELRLLVFDLRFSNLDLCILDTVKNGGDPGVCAAEAEFFPTEKTYEVEDVFDADLAIRSMQEFSPGKWTLNQVPFDFFASLPDPVTAALTKVALRDTLDAPSFDLGGGLVTKLNHYPYYRNLQVEDADGNNVDLTSDYEKGLDLIISQLLIIGDVAEGGLGFYDFIWPDAQALNGQPYHKTGQAFVHPLVLMLTPSPDGPLGEKWGTFPLDLQFSALAGSVFAFSGGGWWVSVSGNEMNGGLSRRDFASIIPQYVLGQHKGAGGVPYGVMPDGTVKQGNELFTKKPIEIGAPHWVNQYNSNDPVKRAAARDFVRNTTTLQTIETLQHGMGFMHTHEPRLRYHYDGEIGSIARLNELLEGSLEDLFGEPDARDEVGLILHQIVNQYTTLGVSSLWCQCTSDWNGVGPHSGMKATLLRSHVREEAKAGEEQLAYAIEKYNSGFAANRDILKLLKKAAKQHKGVLKNYDDWEYEKALYDAMKVLSLTDQALTLMGEPDRIFDPILELGLTPPNN